MDKFKSILLAEDDKDDYLFFVEALLKVSPSYNIIRATNGLDCINILKAQNNPDLIFLDLNMPVKSGLDCLRFIKNNEELQHIPVVIYSTSHYIKDIDAAYKNDAHYYIVKPADAAMLVEVLHIVFKELQESDERPTMQDFVIRLSATMENK